MALCCHSTAGRTGYNSGEGTETADAYGSWRVSNSVLTTLAAADGSHIRSHYWKEFFLGTKKAPKGMGELLTCLLNLTTKRGGRILMICTAHRMLFLGMLLLSPQVTQRMASCTCFKGGQSRVRDQQKLAGVIWCGQPRQKRVVPLVSHL